MQPRQPACVLRNDGTFRDPPGEDLAHLFHRLRRLMLALSLRYVLSVSGGCVTNMPDIA